MAPINKYIDSLPATWPPQNSGWKRTRYAQYYLYEIEVSIVVADGLVSYLTLGILQPSYLI